MLNCYSILIKVQQKLQTLKPRNLENVINENRSMWNLPSARAAWSLTQHAPYVTSPIITVSHSVYFRKMSAMTHEYRSNPSGNCKQTIKQIFRLRFWKYKESVWKLLPKILSNLSAKNDGLWTVILNPILTKKY